jgi:hypothetical protein
MFCSHLAVAIGAMQARIAGAVPQYGCWHATSITPGAVVGGRIHPVVPEQRPTTLQPGGTKLWHKLVTFYKIRA